MFLLPAFLNAVLPQCCLRLEKGDLANARLMKTNLIHLCKNFEDYRTIYNLMFMFGVTIFVC